MSHTLLDGINEVFKRTNNIAGDAQALTSIIDSARQHPIDVTIQVINEGIDELYSSSHVSLEKSQAESTITLVNGQREYALAVNLVELYFPLIDKTNTCFLYDYPSGYNGILLLDPNQSFTGLPIWATISPITNQLRLDRAPTAAEAGRVYTYQYEKDMSLALATDPMPFTDAVFRAMVPAWVQLYKREMRNEFDGDLYKMAIGRASRFITEKPQRTTYSPRTDSAKTWLW